MNLRDQLIRDEAKKLKPYRDSVGKLTIGVGRNLDDVGISDEEAEILLANDIARATSLLAEKLPWTVNLDEVRRAVLLNMTFNLGIFGLLAFKRTLELVQFGDYAGASLAMLQSLWAKQVGVRATRLAEQMKTGEWQ